MVRDSSDCGDLISSGEDAAESASGDGFLSTGPMTGDADGVSELFRLVYGGLGSPCTGQGVLVLGNGADDTVGEAGADTVDDGEVLRGDGRTSGAIVARSSSKENLRLTRGEF